MNVAYVLGPLTAPTTNDLHNNIQNARDAAIFGWRSGYAVICPHLNSAYMQGIMPEEAFLSGGLELLERADLIITVPGHEQSPGSIIELTHANVLKKEIIHFNPKIL